MLDCLRPLDAFVTTGASFVEGTDFRQAQDEDRTGKDRVQAAGTATRTQPIAVETGHPRPERISRAWRYSPSV